MPPVPPEVQYFAAHLRGVEKNKKHSRGNDVRGEYRVKPSPLFCRNTKQLFVSLAAEYETKINKVNQVSIWDRVVESKDDAILKLPYVRNKYKLVDQGSNLRGLAVNLTLEWNVMPITGSMSVGRRTFTGFTLPKEYMAADPSMGSQHTGPRGGMRFA